MDRTTKIRRFGLAALGLAMMLMTGPMIYGAFNGASEGRIWDPITGKPYADPHETCLVEAEDLIKQTASMESVTPEWEDRWRGWNARCRTSFPQIDKLLQSTRRNLKGALPVPSLGQPKRE